MQPIDGERLNEEVADLYSEYLNPGLAKVFRFAGLGVESRAEGCYVYDATGRRFLDCLGGYGVFSLGHRHPAVVQSVKDQLDRMPLPSKIMFNEPQARLAAKLAQVLPGDLQYTFFCNSGTEAVEGALKIARKATGRTRIVSTLGSYHGKTFGGLSASGREVYKKPFLPLLPDFEHVPFGDLSAAETAIDEKTAAFIVEPVQGEGGILIPPAGYLRGLRHLCDRHGALLIADEVQTGLGRTGFMFGVDRDGVAPHIITLAKCLGGGVMPIGAFSSTPAIWDAAFGDNPLIHTSTFGGNQLACAAGLAALNVIESEGLVERSRTMGQLLVERLRAIQDKFNGFITDVRGLGLMIGVEFAEPDYGELTVTGMIQRGVIAAYTLNNPKVIRFEPPLIITETHIDEAARAVEESVLAAQELVVSIA